MQILANPNNLVNVCRPATLILRKLVDADGSQEAPSGMIVLPGFTHSEHTLGTGVPSSSSGKSPQKHSPAPGSVYRFGFDVVYEQMKRERGLLEVVVGRLGSGESMMVLYRCERFVACLVF